MLRHWGHWRTLHHVPVVTALDATERGEVRPMSGESCEDQLTALRHYTATLVAALEWYTIDEHYRGHDPEILYDVGCIARDALGGDRS